jgi:hypothetical protein
MSLPPDLDAMCTRLERWFLRRTVGIAVVTAFVLSLPLYIVVGLALVELYWK